MKILTISATAALLLVLTGCNTVRGVGQDIQKAGESIENAVKKK